MLLFISAFLTYKNVSQDTPPLGSQVAAFPCFTQLNLLWNLRSKTDWGFSTETTQWLVKLFTQTLIPTSDVPKESSSLFPPGYQPWDQCWAKDSWAPTQRSSPKSKASRDTHMIFPPRRMDIELVWKIFEEHILYWEFPAIKAKKKSVVSCNKVNFKIWAKTFQCKLAILLWMLAIISGEHPNFSLHLENFYITSL